MQAKVVLVIHHRICQEQETLSHEIPAFYYKLYHMFIIVKHTQVFDLNCCLLCNRTYREPLNVSVVRVEFNKRKQPQRKKELTIKLDENKLYIGKRTAYLDRVV